MKLLEMEIILLNSICNQILAFKNVCDARALQNEITLNDFKTL